MDKGFNKTRIAKWDNLKCILIILVVIGHFANQFEDKSETMRIIAFFIYTFHMPLFIFLSGLLEKKWTESKNFKWNKVFYFIIIGYALKILIYLTKISFGRNPVFNWLSDDGIPWFMFAMAAFYIIGYLLRNVKWRLCLAGSLMIACLAGYCNQIDSFLNLSRIMVFFPFYYLGYIMDPDTLLEISKVKNVKYVSLCIILCTAIITIAFNEQIYPFIRLLTGRNPYDSINDGNCCIIHRMIFYMIVPVIGWAVLNLAPEKKNREMGYIGSHTLQIYFWHRLVLYVIMYSGFASALKDTCATYWILIYLAIAIITTIVLSDKIFNKPLKWLRKLSIAIVP